MLLLTALSFAALVCHADASFQQGLLWKIEGSGSVPSYLFGTMHSDAPEVTRLPTPVKQAFDNSDGLTLEVTFDPQSLLTMATSMMMADGRTLKSMTEPSLYRKAVEAMALQGMPENVVERMKPWAVAVALSMPPTDRGVVLDHSLYQQAQARRIPVDGLETASEQMAIFDVLTASEQVQFLEETLQQLPQIDDMLKQLQSAYLSRDLAELVRINEASMSHGDKALADKFVKTAIVDRNRKMADRMQSRLEKGNWFIAVGALHLPGEKGILRLLTNSGYKVTRIY